MKCTGLTCLLSLLFFLKTFTWESCWAFQWIISFGFHPFETIFASLWKMHNVRMEHSKFDFRKGFDILYLWLMSYVSYIVVFAALAKYLPFAALTEY